MSLSIIHSDPALLNGTPVFRGTRVPVESLFMHLEKGVSVAEFLADFPSVTAQQVQEVLAVAEKVFGSRTFWQQYESAA